MIDAMKSATWTAGSQERVFVSFFRAFTILIALTSFVLSGSVVRPLRAETPSSVSQGWDEGFLNSIREKLLDEFNEFERANGFGRSFKVKTSERFVFVYDTSDAYLEWLRALTEEVAKAFDRFCERLDLEVVPPSEPLVVVVFATREEFDQYAFSLIGPQFFEGENKPTGFYNHGNNRSVIFDLTDTEASRVASNDGKARDDRAFSRRRINSEARAIKTRGNAGSNTSTIVHEISHQLAFNYGVFSLYRRQPDWVVEGMATTFQPTNDDAPLGWRFRGVFPVNEPRLTAFVHAANTDANLEILNDIVTSDRFEKELSIDGYAASWALFYYCYRKKPKELKKYIERLKEREPRKVYTERERMEEFEECFGDAGVLGKQFVQFIKKLNSR